MAITIVGVSQYLQFCLDGSCYRSTRINEGNCWKTRALVLATCTWNESPWQTHIWVDDQTYNTWEDDQPCLCRAVLQPWYHFHTPFHSCWEPVSSDTKCLVLALLPDTPTVQFFINTGGGPGPFYYMNDFNVYQGRLEGKKFLTERYELRVFSKLVVCIQALEFRTCIKLKLVAHCSRWRCVRKTSPFNWGSFFSVYLATHWHHLRHKTNKAFPLCLCTLQKLEGMETKPVLYIICPALQLSAT